MRGVAFRVSRLYGMWSLTKETDCTILWGQCRVAEIQVFLAELVRHFHFRASERTGRVRRENCLVMLPMVDGEEGKGNQLPLEIVCL